MRPEQLDTLALGLAGGLVGLAAGSFLTVVISRLPDGQSLWPRSACPACGHRIAAYDNIPLISWLVLRGRCRHCSAAISPLYPAVEAATALLFAAVGVFMRPLAVIPAYLYAAGLGLALALIDARTRRLPDRLVYPSYPVLAALLAAASWITGDWSALGRGGIGGLALGAFYFLLASVPLGRGPDGPRWGMGLGDAKLAGLIGLALAYRGWGAFAVGALAAFFLGAVWGIGVIVKNRGGRPVTIPFGPWMCAGAGLGVAFGAPLWDIYRGLMAF
ncbi:MAG: prepilin peptidase [Bifidobacteriaceae bacterium]|nr:prepilin peptidase [Bifidobacteriaceae bacterium]